MIAKTHVCLLCCNQVTVAPDFVDLRILNEKCNRSRTADGKHDWMPLPSDDARNSNNATFTNPTSAAVSTVGTQATVSGRSKSTFPTGSSSIPLTAEVVSSALIVPTVSATHEAVLHHTYSNEDLESPLRLQSQRGLKRARVSSAASSAEDSEIHGPAAQADVTHVTQEKITWRYIMKELGFYHVFAGKGALCAFYYVLIDNRVHIKLKSAQVRALEKDIIGGYCTNEKVAFESLQSAPWRARIEVH